jgi:hypothetical protein
LVSRKNKDGDLPLHATLSQRDEPSALLVIDVLNAFPKSASIRNGAGYIPLFLACNKPKIHPSVIKAIIHCYPSATKVKQFGSTSLHALTYTGSGHPDAIKYLLTVDSTLASQENNFGNLPLHYLVVNRLSSVTSDSIRQLVHAYPNSVIHMNLLGETPLKRLMIRFTKISNTNNSSYNNEQEIVEQGLRCMLRSVDYKSLSSEEQKILKDLNWKARRDVVLGLALGHPYQHTVIRNSNDYSSHSSSNSIHHEAATDYDSAISGVISCNGQNTDLPWQVETQKSANGNYDNTQEKGTKEGKKWEGRSNCEVLEVVAKSQSVFDLLMLCLHCREIRNKIISYL